MASALIHIAIAKEVNKKLKRKENIYLLGSIAPDISKFVGHTKKRSHFMENGHNEPNIDYFLSKYSKYLDDDFVIGYYIHLLVDYFWFKDFIPKFIDEENDTIKTLNGEIINVNHNKIIEYIYNNYSSLNNEIIKAYNLDLNILNQPIPYIKPIINELPSYDLKILTDKILDIIKNDNIKDNYIFDLSIIDRFIADSVENITQNLKELKYLDQ